MKKQSTTKGFAILSAAGIITKIFSLLYIPFLLSIITKTGWGYYYFCYQIYVFIYVITNAGIPVAISKLISELTAVKNYKDAVRSFKLARALLFLVGFVMTVIMLIIAYPFTVLMNSRTAYLGVLALSPAILFTSISSAYRGYFQGRENMTPTAVSQIIEQTINAIATVAFAALLMKYGLSYGIAGGTFGTTLAAMVSALYLTHYYKKNNKFKVPREDINIQVKRYSNKQLFKRILNYGIPITVCVGMNYAGNLVDACNTVKRLMASGKYNRQEAYALYGRLGKFQTLVNVPIAIITALAAAILPAIAGAVALKRKKDVKNKVNYALRLCLLISVPSAVGLAVLSEPVFTLLVYGQGAYLMTIGSVIIVLMAIVQIQTSILQGIGKIYTATFYAFVGIVVKITTNYILIAKPDININGAIYGSMLGFFIPMILNQRMIRRTLKVNVSVIGHAIKPIISSAFMGFIVLFTYKYMDIGLIDLTSHYVISNAVSTLLAIFIGIYVYAYVLVFIGGIRKEDLNSLPSKVVRFMPRRMRARVR